jgi:ABC-type transporter Mla subunit MlaD
VSLFRRRNDTRLRKDRTGANPFAVGLVVLILIGIGVFFGFTKHVPFTHGFQVNAVVANANSIRANSPVRIAGVNVGKVKAIERDPDSNASVIKMEIDDKGLPIHKDATLKIRPRIFLEGNFFVELSPGSPSEPNLDSGDTIPITHTSAPVQLDQVLTALQSDTRADLQIALQNFGEGLNYEPTPADDIGQDPEVHGLTGAQALNKASTYAVPALRDSAIVQDAFLGTEPHDLSGVIKGLARVVKPLARDERNLQDFVTNFNRTMRIFASESSNLTQTISLLPSVLRNANRTFDSLNDAFPSARAFAREILPGVRETPATIDAFFPWLEQATPLLSQDEAGGLINDLRPTVHDLAEVTDATIKFLPQANLLAKCFSQVILPTGDVKIQDSAALTTNRENYKEFWYTMVGLAGESQNFDGNGPYVRFQPGGGDQTLSTGKYGGAVGDNSAVADTLYFNPGAQPIGTKPDYPSLRPPYVSSRPCYQNPIPNLNGAATGPADGSPVAKPPTAGLPITPTPGLPTTPALPRAKVASK